MIDRKLRLIVCAHLLAVVTASAHAAQNRVPGSVEGVVTRTGGTEPVPNVTVALATPPSLSTRNTPHIATTDSAGKFVIEGVPPASYNLIIRADNFHRPQRSGPLSVRIQAGERLRSVRVSLTPTATVSGRILDENGEPTAARVHLEQVRFVDGIRTIGRDQGAILPTNDKGEFRLTEVPLGRYYLRADPPLSPLAFAPVYYPGVPNPEDGPARKIAPSPEASFNEKRPQPYVIGLMRHRNPGSKPRSTLSTGLLKILCSKGCARGNAAGNGGDMNDHSAGRLRTSQLPDVVRRGPATINTEADYAPIVRLQKIIFEEAVAQDASDVHIEPHSSSTSVRFRINGLMKDAFEVPRWLHDNLIARIKILAKLDISERRTPQDGHIGSDDAAMSSAENLRPELLLQGQWLYESSMLMPWFRRGVSQVQSST